ncbi:Hypothetical_protein [Hexamita inflata]|uniref:Hypothetical_protein n=1 Tax=Hexamita inflata TaxID=28002 RepID=A0ABP1H4R5_9EUKA
MDQTPYNNIQQFIFIDSLVTHKSNIVTTVNNDNNFAVFGFNQEISVISQSIINVSLDFETYKSALICFQCDIQVASSILVFIASGQILSALMFHAQSTIQLLNVSVQYRFNSVYSAGLLINITQPLTDFQLANVNIMGYNFMQGGNVYQLVLEVNAPSKISIEQVKLCSESSKLQTDSLYILQLSSSINFDCADICTSNENFVYGLCASVLQNGQLMTNNQTIMCVDPFVFNGELCVCKNDFVLNGSVCVNLVKFITNFDQIQQSQNTLVQQFLLVQKLAIQLNLSIIQQFDVISNQTIVQHNITTNYADSKFSKLNSKIYFIDKYIGEYTVNNTSTFLFQLSQLSNNILQNVSLQVNQLNQSLLQLEQNMFQSVANINKSFYVQKQNISNSILTLNNETSFLFNQINDNITTDANITDFNIATNISFLDIILNNLTKELSLLNEILIYTNEYELRFKCTNKMYTFKTFDIPKVTNIVANDQLSSGFVFDSFIQNAFIDIVSTNSFTLFKTQTVLQNIKIQLNNLIIESTAILTPGTQVTIKQMEIASKFGTQIQTSSALYLIQKASTLTNISNLLLNVSVSQQQTGIIVLIYTLNGKLSINGYQIVGSYYSSNTISLTTFQVQSQSTVSLSYIHIELQAFQCGNLSSLVISYINICDVKINYIFIKIGNTTNLNEITTIQTTQPKYFRYGGMITYSNSSQISIFNALYQNQELWQTSYVRYSGILIGYVGNSQTRLNTICFTNIFKANAFIDALGIVGFSNGELVLNNICAQLKVNYGVISTVAIVGSANGLNSNYTNIVVQLQIDNSIVECGSVLVSILQTTSYLIKNITINNSSIQVNRLVGLLIGSTTTKNGTIQQIYINESNINQNVNDTNIFINLFGGGILGESWGQIYISKCVIQNIQIFSYATNKWSISGGIVGDSHDHPAQIIQSLVQNSTISASGNVESCVSSGGIIGFQYDSNVSISDVKVKNTNISVSSSAQTFSAGLISYYRNQTLFIENSSAQTIQIATSSKQNAGILICVNLGALQAINVYSEGVNTINGKLINNCPYYSVISSQSGC